METINRTFNNASNALWNEIHPNQTPDGQLNQQHGDEPLSGIQGKGTATDPYDAGNRDEQPGAPRTKDNTAVIPEPLASTDADHARNPKSPSNADYGPKNVFISEPYQGQQMNYPIRGASSGIKQGQSQAAVPEQRTQMSTYGQGSHTSGMGGQYTQKSRDTAGSSSATSGAYAYSGQGVRDTTDLRDNTSVARDQGVSSKSDVSGPTGAYAYSGQGVEETTDLRGDVSAARDQGGVSSKSKMSGPTGAYAYSGQVAQDDVDAQEQVRVPTSIKKDTANQRASSAAQSAQRMPDDAAKSMQKENEYGSKAVAGGMAGGVAGGVIGQQGMNSNAGQGTVQSVNDDDVRARSMQQNTTSPSSAIAGGSVGQQSAYGNLDKARDAQQERLSAAKSTPSASESTPSGVDSVNARSQVQNKEARVYQDKSTQDESGAAVGSAQKGSGAGMTEEDGVDSLKKGKESADDTGDKLPKNTKVSEEALKGPKTPAREPYEFEKRLDRGYSRSKPSGPDTSKSSSEGAAAATAQKNKGNGNGHQHHGPITQLKEKVSKVLHHNGNGNGNGTKA
ncbi:uncharacterized protein BO88DRAFT_332224 [Aspergillus vadensis CBS 113365]|uniref:Solid-state culture expressed protein n=1 Tax=Aspergillus vadensis (strain CBS 113365 / IMI 142717 / IBT 24658) TaxID=1448311 RepID=A0A319BPM2_ASPVC|nr:hypothetical protein BO88DRAFT_332224 [Aspergillus vadensis CBS 113365]PYH73110.1 hypothetical protein BO88DRAFT_332224 [Aspergillus vadensis CBS 113365]